MEIPISILSSNSSRQMRLFYNFSAKHRGGVFGIEVVTEESFRVGDSKTFMSRLRKCTGIVAVPCCGVCEIKNKTFISIAFGIF